MRVTKEIAILLKEVGYDVPTNAFYKFNITHRIIDTISAPTVYEVIGWLDSKGVYVEVATKALYTKVEFGVSVYVNDDLSQIYESTRTYPTRLAAYTAGLPIAIDYLKNKKG